MKTKTHTNQGSWPEEIDGTVKRRRHMLARMRAGVGLPGKLLVVTALFVMIAQAFIFVPSIADFRRNWLMQRVMAAKIASLSIEASDGAALPPKLAQELLTTAGVHAVALKSPNFRRLVLGMPADLTIADTFDLRNASFFELMRDGLRAFLAPPGRLIRVLGAPDMMPEDEVDVVIDETPLRAALWTFADNIFWAALVISVLSGAIAYLTIIAVFVRPMMRLTWNIVHYRGNPEDAHRIIKPTGRQDEIGVAEQELAELQTQLTNFLREKARLANIGLAVSKINHDLRNMLASAQLVSDRLATVSDPTVQRFAPRLIRALDRAITLCVDTLKYGRSQEAPPKRIRFALRPLLTEVNESLGTEELDGIGFTFSVAPGVELWADRDKIFRVFSNLIRNAIEAFKGSANGMERPEISITAKVEDGYAVIRVADNGPGVQAHIRPNLFKAFQTLSRSEGSGLGLVICAELVEAHGGEIFLDQTSKGAAFVLKLPQPLQEALPPPFFDRGTPEEPLRNTL